MGQKRLVYDTKSVQDLRPTSEYFPMKTKF